MSEDKMTRIKNLCLSINDKNPIRVARTIMEDSQINMHGPEHHVLDGAALLVALHSAGINFSGIRKYR